VTTACVLRPGEKLTDERVINETGSQVACVLHFAWEIWRQLGKKDELVPPFFANVWDDYLRRVDNYSLPETARFRQIHDGHCTFLQPEERRFITPEAIAAVCVVGTPEEIIHKLHAMEKAGIKVDHESVSQKLTDFSSLVAKVTPDTSVVVLPWQVAANAQQFGRNLAQQHKKAVIFGTDGLFSPGTFTINGSYVPSFGPDITAIAADSAIAQAAKAKYGAFGTFGPPVFAATHVIDEAIASVCKAGQTPSRANVLAAIKTTNEPTSILGQPISFDSHGDLNGGKFFLFKIDSTGKYQLIPSS